MLFPPMASSTVKTKQYGQGLLVGRKCDFTSVKFTMERCGNVNWFEQRFMLGMYLWLPRYFSQHESNT